MRRIRCGRTPAAAADPKRVLPLRVPSLSLFPTAAVNNDGRVDGVAGAGGLVEVKIKQTWETVAG